MQVLVLNAGSSSLKASVVESATGDSLAQAEADWLGGDDSQDAARAAVTETFRALAMDHAGAVGYRVVHGGERLREATLVDDELLDELRRLETVAPLHNRRAVEVIRVGRSRLPSLPQVACFDTTFHAELPEEAWRYPLARDWTDRWHLRRYGFHGLSVEWATGRAAELLGRRQSELQLVVAHLGAGSSVTAVSAGRSVDTSMGFTPLEGLMMGTRSGSVDPGILIALLNDGMLPRELDDGLEHRSGLLGVSGSSASVRELEAREADGDDAARLALAMFSRRAAAGIAAAATALPRVDGIVFTGGIGEHSAAIRASICRRLAALGVPPADGSVEADAVLAIGPISVVVVHAREDVVIARQTASRLGGSRSP
jgi:acetate kinase